MIKRILINKSPTFSYLELYTHAGLNVISGVSGSGKSVFFNSILSAFGLKEPNAELIEINLEIDFKTFGIDLEDWGISSELIDSQGETIVSILKKQNTRYFFNHQSLSKKKLSEIAKKFIRYISVKDANELESKSMLNLFDNLIGKKDSRHKSLVSEYREIFIQLKECKSALEELESKERNIETLKDFAQFEIDKITSIHPCPGEYEKLLHEKRLLSKKEKILQYCNMALHTLDSLDSVYKAFELLEIDRASFESAIIEAREHIESGMATFEHLELDPESLLERLSQLADINRKYGSEENALAHLEAQREKLKEYENISFDKTQLEKKYHDLAQQAHSIAMTLHEQRLKFISLFEKQLNSFGKDLRLKKITLQLQNVIEDFASSVILHHLHENGYDTLEIFLDSIPKNNISSGEYNRLRLSMLCVLAKGDTEKNGAQCRGILILDEIDANLSGEESEGVAKLLAFLSRSYQIFAISHQPFMPLLSDNHYLISKDLHNKGQITLLDNAGKITEIARMISGSNLDKNALNYAKTLLEQQRK
ncbi:AAA family ATPase [Helicobacter sp. MIT 14-3879]|uniref:AAA family ATPase n=1 Tax=Helicobacter sp. MIT 14-3879 TaxID=2040649 RepID=UPI000E1FA022|nr:AAA family ATPase [Helicobacter sp. MIT 14-3879]RDU61731.1 DNA recombination protein RecN [Helicobacter sp. MIT 14-3879]